MVRSYIFAMKSVLREDKIKIDEDTYLLGSLTKACKLRNDQIRTWLPIQKGVLRIVLEQVDKFYNDINQPYLALLYQTILSTMYFGLLRISKVTKGEHLVLACDVHIGANKRKFLLILRTSKTHWKNNKPQLIKISAQKIPVKKNSSELPCPYKLLQMYASSRGGFKEDNESFFIFRDDSVVAPRHLQACLKRAIKAGKFDCKLYSSHSIRIGRTCNLYKLGLSVETIKKIGRWKSNAVFWYLRN